ncbi:MAG: hypothetical protein HFF44_03865 [Lawsonibacter sp.]|nr:hypothetical protein [Lawsonibacter sp.]
MVNPVTSARQSFGAAAVRPTGQSNFTAQLQQARMAPQAQDTVSLSGLSYQRRLDELQKLHESTDYSSMSYKDISLLIRNRFMDAFPNLGAMMGGFYLCAGENSIYEKVRSEYDRHWTEATEGREPDRPPASDPEGRKEWKRYTFGYEGLSDDEIMDKLNEKYSGGTLADRCGMIWEMINLDLDGGGGWDAIRQIQNEMVQRTEGQYGHLFRDNPIRVNAMIGVGENTAISWSQLVKNCYEDRRDNWTYKSEELKQQILMNLEDNLNRLLERLKLTQMDFDS